MRASGESGGEYTTLGIREHRDIHSLVQVLQNQFAAQKMILYGRSMGAVSIMNFVSKYCEGSLTKTGPCPRSRGSCSIRRFGRFDGSSTISWRISRPMLD